jgi:hypothetical protein
MSVAKAQLMAALSPPLPLEIVENLIKEYLDIKQHLILAKYSPSELNGGRFAECVLRFVQHIDNPPYTPFGKQLPQHEQIIRRVEGNVSLQESERFYIPRLARLLVDIRNRRNVAHVGGEVDPNYSDALFVSQVSDWILVELVRMYYSCPIGEARKIVASINQVHIPIIFSVNGFLKVQDSSLGARDKILVLLYYKNPESVLDSELQKWTRYVNGTNFRKTLLKPLDEEALIHYDGKLCTLTPKGVAHVEKNLRLELVV